MRRSYFIFLLLCIASLLLYSCKKDYSFEGGSISKGSLKSITGDCLGNQLSGSFTNGSTLTDSNFVSIKVRVITPGRYSITSDTLNGFYFTGNGLFADSGIVSVVLNGIGTPLSAGNINFHLNYDATVCTLSINVSPKTTDVNANYSLQGSPNTCMLDTVKGIYIINTPLADSNNVIVTVNVITAGKYNIITDQVNGYSFSVSGIFTVSGTQTVVLKGAGTPALEGNNLFTVTAGTSSCTFSINVVHAVTVKNGDHFPMTSASFWTYDDVPNPPDTLKRTVIATKFLNGNLYNNIEESYHIAQPAEFYYRKSDTSYFEYGSVDKYTTSFNFVPQINGDILFLKEHLKTGETWLSTEYAGPFSTGQKIYFMYSFTCLDANANVTIKGNTFTNVYKILMKPRVHSEFSFVYSDTGETIEVWYALGIGIIYSKRTIPLNSPTERNIRNWLVN